VSRKPLLIIFVTVFIDLLGFGIVLPLLPRYAEHFMPVEIRAEAIDAVQQFETPLGTPLEPKEAPQGQSPGTRTRSRQAGMILGCLMASFSAMQFLFAPLWGKLSDRIGRRPVLLVGLAGSTVFYALFALVTQWGNSGPIFGISPLVWLFVTRIGAGISGATIPTAQAYIADNTDEKSRGKGMAIIGAAFGIGFIFGPLLGSMFVPASIDAAPSAAPGYVAAVLSGIAFLYGLMSLPESLKRGSAVRSASHGWLRFGSLLRVLANRSLGPIVLAVFMTTFAFAQFETTLATLTKRIGVNDRNNFFVFAYIGLILTLAQGLLVRRLIPRLGELRMSVGGVILMTAGLFLMGQMASRSQALRAATDRIASLKIDQLVQEFEAKHQRLPGNYDEFSKEILEPNDVKLWPLPADHVYSWDMAGKTLSVAERSSSAISPFWTLIVMLPVVVVGFAATTPALQSMLSLNTSDDEQGEVLGVGQSLSALARIAGPVVGLSLQEKHLAYPYWFGGVLMAFGVVMVMRLKTVIKSGSST
jgi:MFS transporter, DHA1 family, tetracycline resistance protein